MRSFFARCGRVPSFHSGFVVWKLSDVLVRVWVGGCGCVCVCVCVCVCACKCVCACVRASACVCPCAYVCERVRASSCVKWSLCQSAGI